MEVQSKQADRKQYSSDFKREAVRLVNGGLKVVLAHIW